MGTIVFAESNTRLLVKTCFIQASQGKYWCEIKRPLDNENITEFDQTRNMAIQQISYWTRRAPCPLWILLPCT